MAKTDFSQFGGVKEDKDFSQFGGTREDAIAPMSQTNVNLLPRIAGDIASGGAQAGYGLLNAPANLAQMLSRYGVISPQTAGMVPRTREMSPQDISSFYGVSDPNAADKLLQGMAQYAPAAALGGATLPGQIGAGAVYGATQAEKPEVGAIAGAAGAAIPGGIGAAVKQLPNALKSVLSKYAASGMTKSIAGDLENVKGITNADAFNMAKDNFDKASNAETEAWQNAKQEALDADVNKNATFDNANYINKLKNKLTDLGGQAERQSAFGRANTDSMAMLQGYMKDEHGTFTDAIEHNQSLNKDYQNEITPGKSLPFSTVNFAKNSLKNTLNQNIKDNSLEDSLGISLQNANQATINKNTIFNEITGPTGGTQISNFMKYYKGEGEFKDPTSFVNQYLPTKKAEGTQKMEQFAQMLGDTDSAKNVLKLNYFGDTLKSTGMDPKSFLKKYNNLSDDQANYLFSDAQQNTINALNNIVEKHPDAVSQSPFLSWWHYSVPALVGGTVGHFMGIPFFEAGLGSALGTKLAGQGLSSAFERPGIQSYFTNYLTKGQEPPSALSQALQKALRIGTQSALTPQLVNLENRIGGQ